MIFLFKKIIIKKNDVFLCLLLAFITCSFFQKKTIPHSSISNTKFVLKNTDLIINELQFSANLLDSSHSKTAINKLKGSYLKSRHYYKQIECYLEYCSPFDVKYYINGPLVKKSELEYGKKIFDPHGFQVIEEFLFGSETVDIEKKKMEYLMLIEVFKAFQKKIKTATINDSQIIEMVQFEMLRTISLTLNGYDATFTKTNVEETISVLKGCIVFINNIKTNYSSNQYPTITHQKLNNSISNAIFYCQQNKDYNTFNRLYFITRHINPIYKLLTEFHKSELFPFTPVNYAVNLKSESLFESNSFNLNYFSVKVNDTVGIEKQKELGELLFFDPILSGNNQRACASCHKPELGFTDGLEKAIEFEKKNNLNRNTPTLLNIIYQKNFFHDGRARQLEEQINDVLHNKQEMNSTTNEMILKLNSSDEYKYFFKLAFVGTADTSISYFGILKAIHEYEKTLISTNSRFDNYLRGNYAQLNQKEINGYNIFSGKALCGSCHFFPLFNGLVPPIYSDTEYEVIGVPKSKNILIIDEDEGRIKVTKAYIHQYAFKTPTVRNIELTAPYMHNGIYKTIEDVIDFYNNGGGKGLGINIAHQTLPFDSLHLNKKEINDIKLFMLSLTDTIGLNKKPKHLPLFKDEKLNNRVIGGVY